MNYQELNGISIREGFERFHKENPQIFSEFEKEVLRALSKGRKRVSAKLIINWIRWNVFVNSSDENFKINDAMISYYAREFVRKHPHHKDVFEFRKLRNEQGGPYVKVGPGGQLEFLTDNGF